MTESNWLAEQFEQQRGHLKAVAYRLLGSAAEAEDAVQEAWLRLNRSDAGDIGNLGGWLTTVVSRICLDQLRARKAHGETELPPETAGRGHAADHDVMLADAVGAALLVVLEKLTPAERVAFVLHDLFDVPFEQVGGILERSPAATRQLASRARRRVRGAESEGKADERQRRVVEAFMAASRSGNLEALLALLDPEIVLQADATAVGFAAGSGGAFPIASEIRGARAVAATFLGRAQGAKLARIDGEWGMVWAPGGKPRAVFQFVERGHGIVRLEVRCDADFIGGLEIVPL